MVRINQPSRSIFCLGLPAEKVLVTCVNDHFQWNFLRRCDCSKARLKIPPSLCKLIQNMFARIISFDDEIQIAALQCTLILANDGRLGSTYPNACVLFLIPKKRMAMPDYHNNMRPVPVQGIASKSEASCTPLFQTSQSSHLLAILA